MSHAATIAWVYPCPGAFSGARWAKHLAVIPGWLKAAGISRLTGVGGGMNPPSKL